MNNHNGLLRESAFNLRKSARTILMLSKLKFLFFFIGGYSV